MTRADDDHEGHCDRLARCVARCLDEDPGLDWEGAFGAARRIVGVVGRGALPSHALVRRHLEALQEARHGEDGARLARRARVIAIVELLEFVRFALEPTDLLIVGLLARRVAVGPLELHARLVGGRPFHDLFGQLESVGIKEMRPFSTVGPMGRFESLHFDSEGQSCTLTRIPPDESARTRGLNLVTGRQITQVTLDLFSEFFAAPPDGG